ncbi:MAG: flagellar assembly protein FliH [Hydrogenophilaceae bacterium]|nr:flagellar assembly protein FliH [Hydrogenophilaceae bacterium]
MSSAVIPKERLTAYQRWELASFDDETDGHEFGNDRGSSLEAIKEAARVSGHAEGFAEGLKESRAHTEALRERLNTLFQNTQHELAGLHERISAQTLDLALTLAKAMLHQALHVRPELILPVVRDAISRLPAISGQTHLLLNPDDLKLVNELMKDELAAFGIKTRPDVSLNRGGCRIETHTGAADASIESRWQRICKALGQDNNWLDEA